MGMYDSIITNAKCPHCGKISNMDFHTKSLECFSESFTFPDVVRFKNETFEIDAICGVCKGWIEGEGVIDKLGIIKKLSWWACSNSLLPGSKVPNGTVLVKEVKYADDYTGRVLKDALKDRNKHKKECINNRSALIAVLFFMLKYTHIPKRGIRNILKTLRIDLSKDEEYLEARGHFILSIVGILGGPRMYLNMLLEAFSNAQGEQ